MPRFGETLASRGRRRTPCDPWSTMWSWSLPMAMTPFSFRESRSRFWVLCTDVIKPVKPPPCSRSSGAPAGRARPWASTRRFWGEKLPLSLLRQYYWHCCWASQVWNVYIKPKFLLLLATVESMWTSGTRVCSLCSWTHRGWRSSSLSICQVYQQGGLVPPRSFWYLLFL